MTDVGRAVADKKVVAYCRTLSVLSLVSYLGGKQLQAIRRRISSLLAQYGMLNVHPALAKEHNTERGVLVEMAELCLGRSERDKLVARVVHRGLALEGLKKSELQSLSIEQRISDLLFHLAAFKALLALLLLPEGVYEFEVEEICDILEMSEPMSLGSYELRLQAIAAASKLVADCMALESNARSHEFSLGICFLLDDSVHRLAVLGQDL